MSGFGVRAGRSGAGIYIFKPASVFIYEVQEQGRVFLKSDQIEFFLSKWDQVKWILANSGLIVVSILLQWPIYRIQRPYQTPEPAATYIDQAD